MKRLALYVSILIIGVLLIGCDFSRAEYTLYFNSNGGSEVVSIESDGKSIISIPEEPIKEGFVFSGWYLDNNTFSQPFTANSLLDSPLSSNITIYANWIINQYTITFDVDGGIDVDSITQDYNSLILFPNTTKIGYSFTGWYINSDRTTLFDYENIPAENITLYAKWEVNQYTITFDCNEGSLIDSITQVYKTLFEQIENPTREGYSFNGWFVDEELTNVYRFSTIPAEDIILYAKWQLNSYEIQFIDFNGTIVDSQSFPYNTELNKVDFIGMKREGYTFTDWYMDVDLTQHFNLVVMPANDINLYAGYSLNIYLITYEDYDGTVLSSESYVYGAELASVLQPQTNIREGYTFDEWDIQIPGTMPSEDIVITAIYKASKFTITYESEGGTDYEPQIISFNSEINPPTKPIKEGFIFYGWFTDLTYEEEFIFDYMPAANFTIYAKWVTNFQHLYAYFAENGTYYSDLSGNGYEIIDEYEGYTLTIQVEADKTIYIFISVSEETTNFQMMITYQYGSFNPLYISVVIYDEDISFYGYDDNSSCDIETMDIFVDFDDYNWNVDGNEDMINISEDFAYIAITYGILFFEVIVGVPFI